MAIKHRIKFKAAMGRAAFSETTSKAPGTKMKEVMGINNILPLK